MGTPPSSSPGEFQDEVLVHLPVKEEKADLIPKGQREFDPCPRVKSGLDPLLFL